jgi:prephenate dehydratase
VSQPIRVAIQGELGSFSEEAAVSLLGSDLQVLSFRHFDEVFRVTSSGEADVCLVPLENALTGSIHRNYDLLRRHKLKINGELYLEIQHNLIVLPGVRFEELTSVFSHPVALGQCERFFERNPQLEMRTSHDTSGSVRELVEQQQRQCGAIAGKRAAELFGGEVIKEAIQDNKANYTRFVLLSPEMKVPGGANKTSIVFSFKNVPGALFKSLSVFALRDIDLGKIESRPIHGRPWEYLFYMDFLACIKEERVSNALNHLREITEDLEILGSYERDEAVENQGM